MEKTSYKTNDKVLTKVYSTKQYGKFKMNRFNRSLSENRINRLIHAFKNDANVPPIEVVPDNKNKLLIVDGQHRFAALRKLHLPVAYYLTYLEDYKTTQGLRARNAGKSWNTMDTVVSFANNPNESELVQKEYSDLQALLEETRNQIGRVPLIPVIEAANGIDRSLDQPNVVYTDHDWQDAKFKLVDKNGFLNVIDRIKRLQSMTNAFLMKASTFRALFAMMADNDLNIEYFADLINQHPDEFKNCLLENNASKLLASLIGFYNSQVMNEPQFSAKLLSSTNGVHGVVMTGTNFNKRLFL